MRRKGSQSATSKALVTLIIAITAIAPALTIMATNKQNQQASNPDATVREGAPATATCWAKSYGGGGYDYASSVQETADGGYVAAGYTHSFGAGSYDAWVLKLNSTGSVTWQKSYGGSGDDRAFSVQQTADGGYIVAGATASFGAGSTDVWVLKLDSSGSVTWQATYGGSDSDEAYSVQQTSDGGYVAAGYTGSFGAGSYDAWVLRFNSVGSVVWQKSFGGSGDDRAFSVQQTADGGYIVAGATASFGAGSTDVWVLKLDSSGSVTWQATYGGNGSDEAYSVQQTSDGGYVVAGTTYSYGMGDLDVWVLKLSSVLSVTWQKSYGGSGDDRAFSVQQTADGGYIVAGATASFGAGSTDVWVLKLDSSGSVTWQKTYGYIDSDEAYSVQQTADGGYIVAGQTSSFTGSGDVWALKLFSSGSVVWDAGSRASTQTTSAMPSDSSATVDATSVVPASSTVTAQNTLVAPQETQATLTIQSSPTTTILESGGGLGIPVVAVLIIVVVALVLLVTLVYVRRGRGVTGVPTGKVRKVKRKEERPAEEEKEEREGGVIKEEIEETPIREVRKAVEKVPPQLPSVVRLSVLRGGQVVGGEYVFKVKVMNDTPYNISNVGVTLAAYPADCLTCAPGFSETRRVNLVEAGGFVSPTFTFRPTKDCVKGTIKAVVNYVDHLNKLHMVEVEPHEIAMVCGLLKPLVISEKEFENSIKDWVKTDGNVEIRGMNAKTVFEKAHDLLRDNNFHIVASHEVSTEGAVFAGVIKGFAQGKYSGKRLGVTLEIRGETYGEDAFIRVVTSAEDDAMIAPAMQEVLDGFRKPRLGRKKEYYQRLGNLILKMADEMSSDKGGIVSLADLSLAVTERVGTGKIPVEDVEEAIRINSDKGLMGGIKKLSSGIKIIEVKPIELSKDLNVMLSEASGTGVATVASLMKKRGWSKEVVETALERLAQSGIAKKVIEQGNVEKWYFPAFYKPATQGKKRADSSDVE